MDPIYLTQKLIEFPSITPDSAGSLDYLQELLSSWGFTCYRLPFEEVDNLYARLGKDFPNFCFAGHVDVVPVVDLHKWTHPPFSGQIENQILYGRGVVDMKGALAAFLSALADYLPSHTKGSISLLLTSDEEGKAFHGTKRVIQWLEEQNEHISACLVGEPTNPTIVGEMVKVGRRGSLNASIVIHGQAGHVAYPEQAINPIPFLLNFLTSLIESSLDQGADFFDPSHLEITTIDVGNPTSNVIPDVASAKFNIRFNPHHSGNSLTEWLQTKAQAIPIPYDLSIHVSGEPFFRPDDHLKKTLSEAIYKVTNRLPEFSTTGGTSDARFIHKICPVIEFGLINKTAHHINEHVSISEIYTLKNIYLEVLKNYF